MSILCKGAAFDGNYRAQAYQTWQKTQSSDPENRMAMTDGDGVDKGIKTGQ
jgi:hypothetical protein